MAAMELDVEDASCGDGCNEALTMAAMEVLIIGDGCLMTMAAEMRRWL